MGTGIGKIISNQVAGVSAAYKIFPQLKRGSVDRHSGDVGILIRLNYTSLLPKGVEDNFCEGNLRAVKTLFGTGWVLGGPHPSITAYTNKPDRVAENNTGIWPKPTHRTNNVRTNPLYKSMEVETKETLRSMERKMDGLETESNEMKETMENMKRKVDSLQAENTKIKEDMTKTSQEIHPLRTINEELQKEMNTLKTKTRSTETELRNENNKIKEDMAEIIRKVHPLRAINEELQTEMSTMKTKTRNTETELRKEMEVMRKKIIFLENQQHKNTNQLTDNETRLEKINEITTAIQNSTTNIDNSKKEENNTNENKIDQTAPRIGITVTNEDTINKEEEEFGDTVEEAKEAKENTESNNIREAIEILSRWNSITGHNNTYGLELD